MQFVEARELAQRSLRLKRSAEGYEVLGDVYRMQGRTDEAINMYTMSLQLNPRNAAMMERLQRLARASGSNTGRRYDTRSNSPAAGRTPATPPPVPSPMPYPSYTARAGSVGANIQPEKRPLLKAFAMVFGYGTAFFLLLAMNSVYARIPCRETVRCHWRLYPNGREDCWRCYWGAGSCWDGLWR